MVLAEIDPATIGNVFACAEYNGLFYNGWLWQVAENLHADLYAQYYSNKAPGFQTDRHFVNLDWLDLAWDYYYADGAKDLSVVLQKTNEQGMEKQHAVAQIFKVLVYQRNTDYWGPIPYSDADNGIQSVLTTLRNLFTGISLSSSIRRPRLWPDILATMLLVPMTRYTVVMLING